MRKHKMLASLIAVAVGLFVFSSAAQAQKVTQTHIVGSYWITFKLLPAESFNGPNAKMTKDSGAKPNLLSNSPKPNHHLVFFVKQNGKPVENASVNIQYLKFSPSNPHAQWTSLPVVQMHVTGQGVKTTHFGNNVNLSPGGYVAQVKVDSTSDKFFFSVSQ